LRNHFQISGGFRSLEFEIVQLVLTLKKVANVQARVISCYNKFGLLNEISYIISCLVSEDINTSKCS
jgi:hypothetical protein